MKAYLVYDDDGDLVAVCLQEYFADSIIRSWGKRGVEYSKECWEISADYDCPKGHHVDDILDDIARCDICERQYAMDELLLRPDNLQKPKEVQK